MYEHIIKRVFDIILSGVGLFVMGIPMLAIALFIKHMDPGPAVFRQKRFGAHKSFFVLHKFRSMRLDTPDIPTHLMENPSKYMIKHGDFLRKYSIDELPQLYDIFVGKMSVVGPRPALWNQDDLISERDKYGANDAKPGLTGWAQINGRDELDIAEKARLDGEYVEKMSFLFDVKCFFLTISKVLRHDGFVEGRSAETTLYFKGEDDTNV